MRNACLALGMATALLLLLACQRSEPTATSVEQADPWFVEIGETAGLDFTHECGPPPGPRRYFLPQIIGSGAALFDYDNDGRLDVYLVQNGGPDSPHANRLYRNNGDGTFTDVSKRSGLDVRGFGMGVAVGDIDNDGRPDVLLTEYGRIRLFHNNGDSTFRDITVQAELDHCRWATAACSFDYNRDGRLDFVVTSYVDYDPTKECTYGGSPPDYCHPRMFPHTVTRLYRNGGPAAGTPARFTDVTVQAGLARAPGPGLGAVAADFNGDGWPDILVANDDQPNRLWINQADGSFRDEAVERGLAYNGMGQRQGNMGIAVGDIDGSGRLAVFITHLTEETHALYSQDRPGLFRDTTAAAGIARSRCRGTGFGTVLGDFDNDGALDLAIVNGRVSHARLAPAAAVIDDAGPVWAPYAERNQLFAGDGSGHFCDVSAAQPAFCGRAGVYRGLAVGDLDNDGGLDLLVTAVGGRARLFRNAVRPRGHWLLMRALDPTLKRDAYGAEVIVEIGGKRRHGWVNPGSSYLCSNDPRVHFGLGLADRVDAIEIRWPDGTAERFAGQAADRLVVLRKGEGHTTTANGRPGSQP